MLNLTVSQDPQGATVVLDGAARLEHAAEVHAALLDALNENERVTIRLTPQSRAGLPIMQLLCAAHRTAERLGRTLVLSDESGHLMEDAVTRAGFFTSRRAKRAADQAGAWDWRQP